ncbi:MAG: DUF4286 family protein [Staphylococcus sp.]|nr:DUF4286 family protein [Staphylococcus sp.]
MIILNTSFHVHVSLDEKFKSWVREVYIPSAMSSQLLASPRFAAILIEVQEDCVSYAVSFEAATAEDAVSWHDGEGAELRDGLRKMFGEGVVFFTTYMESLPL